MTTVLNFLKKFFKNINVHLESQIFKNIGLDTEKSNAMKPRLHRLKAFPLVSPYTPGWCEQVLNLAIEGRRVHSVFWGNEI